MSGPFGTRVWDASGNLISEYTDNIGKILGAVISVTGTGSATDDGLLTGTPFYCIQENTPASGRSNTVSISGNVISWNFEVATDPFGTALCSLYWGVM